MRAVKAFLDELFAMLVTPLNVFVWLATTVMVTIAGPFGTYVGLGYSLRALYWLVIILLSFIVSHALKLALKKLRPKDGILKHGVMMSVLMTVVYTPLLLGVAHAARVVRAAPLASAGKLAMYVFVVSMSIALTRWLYALQQRETPRLLERLPESRWGNVLRLSSNDHYVEVVTDKGSETLLMRFGDALAELNGIEGVQVHRPHWVARHAVKGHLRENGRTFLEMIDGSRVPVSRGYLDRAREAGIIDRAA